MTVNRYYSFNDNGVYTGFCRLSPSQVSYKEDGTPIVGLPKNTTLVEPPGIMPEEGYIFVFNKETNEWTIEKKYKGVECIDIDTHEIKTYEEDAPLPANLTDNIPDRVTLPYLKFIRSDNKWVPDHDKKEQLINDIWELRKSIRDTKCEEDIEYNEHFYHVDSPTSLNDLVLAAQSMIASNTLTSERRWVTADSTSVTITGNDIVQILRLYGDRREALVFQSNQDWENDCNSSMAVLLETYKQLSNGSSE